MALIENWKDNMSWTLFCLAGKKLNKEDWVYDPLHFLYISINPKLRIKSKIADNDGLRETDEPMCISAQYMHSLVF